MCRVYILSSFQIFSRDPKSPFLWAIVCTKKYFLCKIFCVFDTCHTHWSLEGSQISFPLGWPLRLSRGTPSSWFFYFLFFYFFILLFNFPVALRASVCYFFCFFFFPPNFLSSGLTLETLQRHSELLFFIFRVKYFLCTILYL